MKIYKVLVRGTQHRITASRAAVAVQRALDKYKERDLHGAAISVHYQGVVAYQYVVVGKPPSSKWGDKYEQIGSPFGTRTAAKSAARVFQEQHPDWSFVDVNRIERT